MASETQIAKLALQHVGDRYDISDLTEESVEAEQVNLIFDDTRDWLLRQHPWGFAKKFATPSALVGTVPNNYDFMYTYMTDAVRIGGVVDPLDAGTKIDFEVARNSSDVKVILTDAESAEFFYTARITDTAQFDPEFVMAFSYALGSKLAMPLTGDRTIMGDLDTLARNTINSAWETDSNEGISDAPPDADWIQARA
jgi:hypothetical protein|tara:strand:- start:1476 stop:2066 length:591 start_codon:yes stop_codon:yes gene_type:complete